MLTHLVLSLALLVEPVTEQTAQAAYNDGDYKTSLRLYLRLASQPGVHEPDALFGAHSALLALYGHTSELQYLCRALSLAERLAARNIFRSADERASWQDRIAHDRLQLQGRTCGTPRRLVVAEQRPTSERVVTPPALLADKPREHRSLLGPSLVIGGALSSAAMIGALVGRHVINQRMREDGMQLAPLDEREREALLIQDGKYQRLTAAAVVAGVVGGVLFTAGLISSLKGRKLRRVHLGSTISIRF